MDLRTTVNADLLFKVVCDLLYNLLEVDEREFDRLFIQLDLKPFLADFYIYFLRLQWGLR